MKTIFTIILALSSLSIFGQIQLDSIVQTNFATTVVDHRISYEYANNKLHSYEEYKNGLNQTSTISYNDSGFMNGMLILVNGSPINIDISYNQEDLMDTIFLEAFNEITLFEISYLNNNIKSVLTSYFEDGQAWPIARKDFEYENDLLVTNYFYTINGNTEELNNTFSYDYNENKQLIKLARKESEQNQVIDSFHYDDAGSLLDYIQTIHTGDQAFLFEKVEYISNPSEIFSDILNPSDQLNPIAIIADNYDSQFFVAIDYANKVEESILTNADGEEFETVWYYSGLVGTNERVVTTPISVYPNPTVDRIRFESEEIMNRFYIYNFGGALISEGTTGNSNEINVENLSAGSYTVICSNKDDEHYFAQFIKQ